jgi:hypothetical protein
MGQKIIFGRYPGLFVGALPAVTAHLGVENQISEIFICRQLARTLKI